MIPRQSALIKALFVLGLIVLPLQYSTQAIAQEPTSRPVARLISHSADVYTRPRRIDPLVGEEALFDANPIERRAFELTNDTRVRNGLTPLQWDSELCRMAREHSEKMAHENFFSHVNPRGERLKDRARAIGIGRFRVIAENISFNQGFPDPGAFAVERWMISPGHRANILHPGFEGSAVGVFVSEDGAVYLTQVFIAR